jgi:Ca2+/Na+ antiporter
LCWQSILVVSTAILFRSKIIILANFLIYLAIAIATMSFSGNSAISCINIGIVALLSARILNSQKDRLDLKTESMRNAYLTIAFLLLPYSTFLLVPIEYVGLTWLAIAILYYVFSVFLNNKKYRWMAIITLAITILYTLLLGILHPDNELKVLSFIIVGGVLIAISIVYTKIKSKDKIENRGD